jgi:glycosyltransferase involved in cell wall biosynthesis
MSSQIRILQLGSPTGLYGAERWILALIKHLNPERIESFVGVIKDEPGLQSPLCNEAEKFGFKTHVFEAHGKINPAAVKLLRSFILKNSINILHTHWYKADILGLLAVRNTQCRIVSTPHGWSRHVDFKLWCYEMLDRGAYRFMDAVAPLSEDIYHSLQKIPGLKKKLHLIRNGVDLSEVEAVTTVSPEIEDWRKRGHFIIGYIGQLIPRKGLEVLLKAVAALRDKNLVLVIIGTGDQEEELKSLAQALNIEKQVHLLGFRTDRLSFLRGFDVFVLPSTLEGIPRCLMEAMAARIPIIASDIPGSIDLIHHEETGLLFQSRSVDDLKKGLERIITDPQLATILSSKANDFVKKEFSASRMAKEYEKLYYQLATKSP